ncbi:MAG: VOC family protein [Rhodospirillaceae bacterium]|nr:VOC family protein [Rhodospirillaceae bacterium]
MGILSDARPVAFVGTANRATAPPFYRDTLGLKCTSEDQFAAVFDMSGTMLRLSDIPNFKPGEHPVLGFDVDDVRAAVSALRTKGVTFLIYEGFGQDDLGIWTAPDGKAQVAWFKDPDGNMLSVNRSA